MATLYISEFSGLAITDSSVIGNAANAAAWVADQTVAIGVSHVESNPFNAKTAYALLSADTACRIAWTTPGASVNAESATSFRLPANTQCLFGVAPGALVSAINYPSLPASSFSGPLGATRRRVS